MKLHRLLIGILAAGLFTLSACEDQMNYKETTQYDFDYISEDFDNVSGLMTYVYRLLDYDYGTDNYYGDIMLSSATDESRYSVDGSAIDYFFDGTWSATTPISDLWTNAFVAITYCNEILYVFNDLEFEDLEWNEDYASDMTSYLNLEYEARWARAYFYFLLVRQYGAVPLKNYYMSAEEANSLSRTSAEEIFEFIDSECLAIQDSIIEDYENLGTLSPSDGTTHNGRPDKRAVMALRARAALYHASPLFNEDNDASLWLAAAEACQELLDYAINERDMHLADTYDCLWAYDNYTDSEALSEILFARRIGTTVSTPESTNYPIGVSGGGSANCPTQNLVDAYDMQETGLSIDEEGSGYDETNPYEGRDPRFALTIAKNGDTWPTSSGVALDVTYGGVNGLPLTGATPTGYYLKKLLHGSINFSSSSKYTSDTHTWVTFRLAEFYLNYAEALFNYTGDPYGTTGDFTMTPVEAVNVVRNRAEMPDLPTDLTASEFKTKYEKERFVELAFEQHRFWDVRRWEEAETYFTEIEQMSLTKDSDGNITYTRNTITRNWDDKYYLFPIPQEDLLKNANLTQNPGW
ncbi:MAG: RagB/SusD family nutrient uptake outer membrane protein [Bacteroides sp.]|nr:RagB/SusD family nutrient uptake outer membrane protein [Bacteroides sp.]